MHWGLVPFWIKSAFEAEKIKKQTLNARLETLSEKPAFREAYKKRRCLIPVDAFFEYHHQGKKTIPFLIRQIDQEPITLAGIYEVWVSPLNGLSYLGFSIVTCSANELMQKVHNQPGEAGPRQPLMLSRSDEEKWIKYEDFKPIGIPDEQLEAFAVCPLNGKKYPGNVPAIWEPSEFISLS
jgi:putative SOS response-associated peptidase YedK